jgi:predicted O-linked N-acetylglucosamine transferase (SPINDLY family)
MRVEQPMQPRSASVDHLITVALAHHQAGRLPEAERLYRQILQDCPGHLEASHLLGVIECQAGNYAIALELIDKAIRLRPDFAEAYNNRGIALQGLQHYELAVVSFGKAIALKPGYADAYNNLGSLLLQLQRYQQALETFDRALGIQSDSVTALYGRGNASQQLRQYEEALLTFDRVLLLLPDDVGAHGNRGNALLALRRYPQALDSFDKAISLQPELAQAHNGRGVALHGLEQDQAALESLKKALLLKPDYAEAWDNNGRALLGLRQYQQGCESFDRALLLEPDRNYLRGIRLHLKQLMCDWEDLETECRELEAKIGQNGKVSPPFQLLAISGSPALQKKAAKIFVRDNYKPRLTPEAIGRRPKRNKIRIGYFSANFHSHAICHLMAELFEQHDRSQFEILGFSFGSTEKDAMSIRVAAAMDRFVDIRFLSDREVAQLSRELEVDIAVDLMGFTQYARTGIFVQRAAPIQVNYLGYPATMGADFIDYLIADSTLIPEASRRHYSEKIAYLPDSFQANDSTLLPTTKTYSRAAAGLPERGFVFCCFNNNYKITPAVFDIWMRTLARVGGSVLWLLETNPWSADNLRKEAVLRGISPKRLVFARGLPMCEHLGRLPLADLFLDTLPFNAGATASPVLWAGLPLLTCMGEAFASRMAGSLLRAIHLPELVTTEAADYEELASALALDTERYQKIREKLWRNRLTAPLFDLPRFTLHLESAYCAMYERHQANLPPEHIHIARLPRHSASLAGLIETPRDIFSEPGFAEAFNERGNALLGLQHYQAALESCDQAIRLRPDYAEAYGNRGSALLGLNQYQKAVESFDQAIRLKPGYVGAYCNRASALIALEQYQASLESCDQAIRLKPDYAEAYCNRGGALFRLQEYRASLESCEKAILLKPYLAEAHNNRGNALYELQQYQTALESFDQAIRLKPDLAEAYKNRGNTLYGLQQHQAALENFEAALLLKPDYEYLLGMRLHLKQLMCDWTDVESQRRDVETRLDRNEKVSPPLPLLAISSSAALQKKAAEVFVNDNYALWRTRETFARRPRRDRIRIGYFSADFHNHAICYLMAELFERHDRSKFEILGFSFGQDEKDAMSIRVAAAMDRFLDVRLLSDREVAQLSRELEVDIAVDLMGFTQYARVGIFAQRAAPVQVNYLGYPATMGADFIDYLIADPTLIPEASRQHYSEKIAYLPDSFQANDSTLLSSTKAYTRAGEGLPEQGFVFCCFNSNHKINPATFDIWMRLLERVDASVLWLVESNRWTGDNLRRQAVRRGISPDRLIFARILPMAEHLTRLPLADLFLDTLPFNAGATASPALWAGLPLLTCMGEALASRMGASLLRAIGLPDLVTSTVADYEALAVALATDPERHRAVRETLRNNRRIAPLFNVPRFTRYLEAAYSAMYERNQAGLLPEHIHLA